MEIRFHKNYMQSLHNECLENYKINLKNIKNTYYICLKEILFLENGAK